MTVPSPDDFDHRVTHTAIFRDQSEVAGLTEPAGNVGAAAVSASDAVVSPGISRRLVILFAVACGVIIANNYYAQPLLNLLAHAFGVSFGVAGLIVTVTQIGYALGLVLIVPLGDILDRRRLIVGVLSGAVLALLVATFAPSIVVLLAASLVLGLTTVVAQVLVPFAANLASEAERGKVVGTVMSGLLLGILLARTASGLISQVAGWRGVYGVAVVATLGIMLALWRELPAVPSTGGGLTAARYRRLLRSVLDLAREEPVLRRRSAYGVVTFAAFSAFWTSAAFLLAAPPYGFSQAVIGLFGLLGAAGALTASVAGRLADRGYARLATGAFLLAIAAGYVLLFLGGKHLVPLVLGMVILDLGAQGTHITNQSEIYRLRPDARSRLTTAYMTAYFVGGAVGSAVSAVAFGHFGWLEVCVFGLGCGLAGLTGWASEFLG